MWLNLEKDFWNNQKMFVWIKMVSYIQLQEMDGSKEWLGMEIGRIGSI